MENEPSHHELATAIRTRAHFVCDDLQEDDMLRMAALLDSLGIRQSLQDRVMRRKHALPI